MKQTSSVVMFIALLFGCNKDNAVQPAQLIGNWKTIENGQPYLEWTFTQDELGETFAKSSACEPVVGIRALMRYSYKVQKDTLLLGYRNNFFETQYIRYPIKSLTRKRLVLFRTYFNEDVIFERCE